MTSHIVPLAASHFTPLHAVLDAVAREKRFLAMTQAPPAEETMVFFRQILEDDRPHFVALLDGAVVGWCDVLPVFGQARAHIGVLGIGLLPSARHRGLGRQLMASAIEKAWLQGLTRIELTVRADNPNARALYERLGFEHEGLQRNGFRVDGEYIDGHAMALLRYAG
ncbi:GNAT family N-acetyltransferase [Hydrogenophaga sp. 2FB]|uniref:GNAT family N-acetyltransferase n=1 Tax=Hydrogenophaga sp. 2FB TaxID=2502187 RepID=UPI0010F91426|nr:GNAT family N-acetyltransferase [Hydrogenophaga sp. 2FB]